MKLLNIGFGNMVNADRIIGIVSPDSAPIKRLVQDAREKGALSLMPATGGARRLCLSWTPTMSFCPASHWKASPGVLQKKAKK